MTMKIVKYLKKSSFRHFLLLATALYTLLSYNLAQAGFRKALAAFQQQDGATMIQEVKNAVEQKNDDGIILFLSLLKQHPKTWRPALNESQQVELFNYLEKAAIQSNLQAQYKLAIIPRLDYTLLPALKLSDKDKESWYEARKQEKLKEYQSEVTRLEPIANKGYAPAAFRLYGNYVHNLTKSKDNAERALKWLIKAAELGDSVAAYLVGLKYLNVRDNYYGCSTDFSRDELCLPKDEANGWYWVQKASKHAKELNIMVLDDVELNMGDLYMQGVAGNKPDYQQAYLWYQLEPNASSIHSPVWSKLEELHKLGELKRLNPALDIAWGNATTWQEAVKSQDVLNAWLKSPNKLPKTLQQDLKKHNIPKPVFSISTLRWYQPNASYDGIKLDVYEDGRANLLMGNPDFNEGNEELWMRLTPFLAKNFFNEVKNLKLESEDWGWPTCVGCLENRTDFISFNYSGLSKTVKIESATFGNKKNSHPQVIEIRKVVEQYYPLSKFICDADVGDDRSTCNQINKEVIKLDNKVGR